MTINQRQFAQLTEMGISLWQDKTQLNERQTSAEPKKQYMPIDQAALSKSQVFSDILKSLSLSTAELSHKDDHLDLGLFNWYFVEQDDDGIINLVNNNLFTPDIKLISQSAQLKKQLWQLISSKLL